MLDYIGQQPHTWQGITLYKATTEKFLAVDIESASSACLILSSKIGKPIDLIGPVQVTPVYYKKGTKGYAVIHSVPRITVSCTISHHAQETHGHETGTTGLQGVSSRHVPNLTR